MSTLMDLPCVGMVAAFLKWLRPITGPRSQPFIVVLVYLFGFHSVSAFGQFELF